MPRMTSLESFLQIEVRKMTLMETVDLEIQYFLDRSAC